MKAEKYNQKNPDNLPINAAIDYFIEKAFFISQTVKILC
jgi:hypothetical protein